MVVNKKDDDECSDRERPVSQCVGWLSSFPHRQWNHGNLPITLWKDCLDNPSRDAQYLSDK